MPSGSSRDCIHPMRVVVVKWETIHQYGEAWISHHRLRYKMFIERQDWNVPSYRHFEYDEFDTPAAAYIIAVNDQNRAIGTVRLLPTTRPYMAKSIWPDLIATEPPHSDEIWEATRFGCDHDLDATDRRLVVARLILGCQEFGIAAGISSYLGVMPLRISKHVIAASGCPVKEIGPTLRLQGHLTAAAFINVSLSTLEAVRRRTGIRDAVLEPRLSLAHFLAGADRGICLRSFAASG